MTNSELLKRINQNYEKMSKGQKRLSDYIQNSYDKAVYRTAQQLGDDAGVSESTVVRFAMTLGYKGYPEFQKALEEMALNKLNSIQRMEVSSEMMSQSEILEEVLKADADNIKETLQDIDELAFKKAVDIISGAKKVYVIGIRSCQPLASFLSFYLNLMVDNVILLETNNPSEIFESMIRISGEDAIVGISFPRYSVRTMKALEFAKNRGAKVVSITDTANSPMSEYSDTMLLSKSNMVSFVDSLVAPLSVINALIVSLSLKKNKEVVSTLKELEEIWGEYQVYENDEMDSKKNGD